MTTGGHYQEGETDTGQPLQDVAANKLFLAARYERSKWLVAVNYNYRFEKSRVASGEQAVDNAQLLSGSISLALSDGVSISLWGRNLLDDTYLISTDDVSTDGEHRAIGVRLVWRG